MATKTFKIGLSNTDKQNMAQDVYERLLALTFPEYDTETSYEVGDFVVYNDQLYKCIGSTSGAWDSTKWQLATLNDLLTDIESAVAFVNDKANVDGNYPTMTVGVADQLSPYDDESGDDQDEPFSFQATGTGNGTQPDFSTGAIALMKEKQGNTICVNQYLQNGNFVDTSNWIATRGTISATSNELTYTITQLENDYTANRISQIFSQVVRKGDYIYVSIFVYPSHDTTIYLYATDENSNLTIPTGTELGTAQANKWNYLYNKYQLHSDRNLKVLNIGFNSTTSGYSLNETVKFKNAQLVDLTQWFNGDIPQDLLDNPSNFYRYYQGSLAYNTGELVNANGRYIKCIGRQQWDEERKVGYYLNNGVESPVSGYFTSKNYIRVDPNKEYILYGVAGDGKIAFYDAQQNFISDVGINSLIIPIAGTRVFTVPANCIYIKFYNPTTTGDISLYLTYWNDPSDHSKGLDGSHYGTHTPYQVLTNNDTGTEQLLAFDKKTPDGTWHKNTRKVSGTDLQFVRLTEQGLNLYRIGRAKSESQKIKNSFGLSLVASFDSTTETKEIIQFASVGQEFIYVLLNTSRTLADFVMEYELADAHKTTEQGTPFSENLVIDDFGSMDFQGTNGVPQGNLIFYPVDYKAFIDTLYNYTEGTPSELVKQSERTSDKSAQATLDTALQNAIGGTLRHCLAIQESELDFEDTAFVDLGELTWTYVGNNAFSAINVGVKSVANDGVLKALSTKYQVVSYNTLNGDATKVCMCGYVGSDSRIYVRDTAYTDATAFKNAMKGVLLAYEKAEE